MKCILVVALASERIKMVCLKESVTTRLHVELGFSAGPGTSEVVVVIEVREQHT